MAGTLWVEQEPTVSTAVLNTVPIQCSDLNIPEGRAETWAPHSAAESEQGNSFHNGPRGLQLWFPPPALVRQVGRCKSPLPKAMLPRPGYVTESALFKMFESWSPDSSIYISTPKGLDTMPFWHSSSTPKVPHPEETAPKVPHPRQIGHSSRLTWYGSHQQPGGHCRSAAGHWHCPQWLRGSAGRKDIRHWSQLAMANLFIVSKKKCLLLSESHSLRLILPHKVLS